ncbi:CheW protein [Chloroherpeton thalassium ATCC 35110]|uniref:CheW protein n=1 Tax=Chloroherpeton thalassium (strain ATCC 35110 / GB-78) TaxID=517418 RepID=B3QXJ0_CHLT3|nr:chemotaxis protein CheW [Chloroherpeton thalassium]ACF14905.1 CheW protein [Chloroherpeton thalassium ATCC 35110]
MAEEQSKSANAQSQKLAVKLPGEIKVEDLKRLSGKAVEQVEVFTSEQAENVQESEDEVKEQYIAVLIGEREVAFLIKNIDGIIDMQKIIPVPGLPSYVLGVCNVRGEVTSIVDLKIILGFPAKKAQITSRRFRSAEKILILRGDIYSVGFVVDSVLDVVRVAESDVIRISREDKELSRINFCAKGLYARPGEENTGNDVVLIDTAKLLNTKELKQFQ